VRSGNISRDWGTALLNSQRQKVEHGTGDSSRAPAAKHYAPVLTSRQLSMATPPHLHPGPTCSMLGLRGHPPGSRMRQIRAQSLAQFFAALRRIRCRASRGGGGHRPTCGLVSGLPGADPPGGGDPFSDTRSWAV